MLHFVLVSDTGEKTKLLNESAAEPETCEDLVDEDPNQEITPPASIDTSNNNNEGMHLIIVESSSNGPLQDFLE